MRAFARFWPSRLSRCEARFTPFATRRSRFVGGLGALGGLGAGPILPTLDVGVALDRSTYLVMGLSGSYYNNSSISYTLNIPISML